MNIKEEDFNLIFKDSRLEVIAIGVGQGKNKIKKALKLGGFNNIK